MNFHFKSTVLLGPAVQEHTDSIAGVQVGSLQEMDAKLASMAQSGALDPALLLAIAKAHNSVKDTDYTRDEVKEVMAHLYFKVSAVKLHTCWLL